MDKIMNKLNLSVLEKPSRYIDHEINAVHKDFVSADVRVCFAFPDVYEIGISHLGLKILYSIVNRMNGAMADRTYLPWLDGLSQMRAKQIPLYALESKQAVKDFDLLGITLQSELTFTNVLELLDISQIPIYSKDRNASHPLVIAGGPCASNPLPLSQFIDAFLIGEGEDAITEIVNVIRLNKAMFGSATDGFTAGLSAAAEVSGEATAVDDLPNIRTFILQALSQIPGIYVPAIHDDIITRNPDFRIKIRKYNDFHTNEQIHEPQLMPWQLATHNRYVAEIMRGCTRGCRFCHAGYFYRPVRERSPEDILDVMLQEIDKYGWEEAGLISLSSSDYTCIRPLLEALIKKVDSDKTHISLPSLRVDALDNSLVTLLKVVGREGLTIAPEAGSQRLRDIINKNLTEEDILTGIRIAKELGWQRIKLYFMIGLPNETEDDIQAIIDLVNLILSETGKKLQLNITISPFVPKPHTPFQWSPMLDSTELLHRALLVKHAFMRFKYIKIRYHTIESSLLEAIISRGDSKSAEFIKAAWDQGAVYDGWREGFDWKHWTEAASHIGFDLQQVHQSIPTTQALPWDFIHLGIGKNWFVQEWNDACEAKTSNDCRNGCLQCGVCRGETKMVMIDGGLMDNGHNGRDGHNGLTTQDTEVVEDIASISSPESIESISSISSLTSTESIASPLPHTPGFGANYIKSWAYRLTYQKGGDFRYVGHLDWMRMIYRILGRCKLNIVYTQGFNPHPKVSFSPSLAIGVCGMQEYFDFFTAQEYGAEELTAAFSPMFSHGLALGAISPISVLEHHIQPVSDMLAITIPSGIEGIKSKVAEFTAAASFTHSTIRKEKQRVYDLKAIISAIYIEGDILYITKKLESPNVYELLSAILSLPKDDLREWDITRLGMLFADLSQTP